MIYNIFGGEVALIWGNMDSGRVFFLNRLSNKHVFGFLGDLKADSGLTEIETAIKTIRQNPRAAAAVIIERIKDWLKTQPDAVKSAFTNYYVLDGSNMAVLKNFTDWVDSLQAGNTRTIISSKTADLVPVIEDILRTAPGPCQGALEA